MHYKYIIGTYQHLISTLSAPYKEDVITDMVHKHCKFFLIFPTYLMPLGGLCEELEVMEGHNMLEALSFQVNVDGYESTDFIGSIIRHMENVLVRPG